MCAAPAPDVICGVSPRFAVLLKLIVMKYSAPPSGRLISHASTAAGRGIRKSCIN